MGDECTCEKCQGVSNGERSASAWPVAKTDAQAEAVGRKQPNVYLVVTDRGISLRRQSYEM